MSTSKIYVKNLQKNNIFLDLNNTLKKYVTKKDWIFLDSVHINDAGNKLISEIILKNEIIFCTLY